MVGDFLYVSGQGARDRDGRLPATVDAQARQTLENVKTIVEAAGLTWSTSSTARSISPACRATTRWIGSGTNTFRNSRRHEPSSVSTECPPTPRSRSMPSLFAISPQKVHRPRRISAESAGDCRRDGGRPALPVRVVWRRHRERQCARGSGRAGATRAGQHETDVDGGGHGFPPCGVRQPLPDGPGVGTDERHLREALRIQ